MTSEFTHVQLVERARQWLAPKCPVVVTEMVTVGEEPDALGFTRRDTTLIECKASRSDFKSDGKKAYRRMPDRGLGTLRYYMCPSGLIKEEDLPDGWGLLWVTPKRVLVRRKPKRLRTKNWQSEMNILISALRRVGVQDGPGVSVRCYTHQNKNTATLTVEERE